MLDRWIIGEANRMSPEAPVPILKELDQKFSVGGAANLAVNLSNLYPQVELYGSIASDKEGFKLVELLKDTNIQSRIEFDSLVTTTKTRLVNDGGQHLLRWDKEVEYNGSIGDKFIKQLNKNDIVLISDYNKGLVTQTLVASVLEKTLNVYVDPKQSADTYYGAFLVKPNMKEYKEWFGEFNVESARYQMIQHKWKWLVVTDGANGVHVINETEYWHYKEDVREVADVTGAGDTFLAVLAYAHETKQMAIPDSCKLACYASARNVEHRGVVSVTKEDLNKGVVWTNGVFDILHPGHLELLKYAKSLGQKLIVGINDDESVRRLKGEGRPVNDFITRKRQLETLPWVDEVVVFTEDTPQEILEKIRPDIIVKGGDYTVSTTVGNEIARVEIFPIVEGHSTTNIIEKMKK